MNSSRYSPFLVGSALLALAVTAVSGIPAMAEDSQSAFANEARSMSALSEDLGGARSTNGYARQGGKKSVQPLVGLSVGGAHVCALGKQQKLSCWGFNYQGQIGTNDKFRSNKPQRLKSLSAVSQFSAGYRHTCATSGGKAYCWGSNFNGELGNGKVEAGSTYLPVPNPQKVLDLTGVTEAKAGVDYSCAIHGGGSVSCWGKNTLGQLGNGNRSTKVSPTPTPIDQGARALALGEEHVCVLLADGSVRCWGANAYGQLGNGTTSLWSPGAVDVNLPIAAKQISAGFRHTCALLVDNRMFCWGDNRLGQLGDGSKKSRATPKVVAGISGVKSIGIGGRTSCAVDGKKKARCWGSNQSGMLGNGQKKSKAKPTEVKNLKKVAQVAVGHVSACARLKNGAAKCWGDNWSGQLGNGNTKSQTKPVSVKKL